MPQSDARARINDNQLIRLAGKNQAAEVAGDKRFSTSAKSVIRPALGPSVCVTLAVPMLPVPKSRISLRDFMPRDEIGGLKTAEEIADGNTDDAKHDLSPF